MKVWFVASEVAPFSKTGGLADVAGSLPRALDALGLDVTVVAPCYRGAWAAGVPLENRPYPLGVPVGVQTYQAGVESGRLPGSSVRVHLLRYDLFFDRDGLYGTGWGDYTDNLTRFVFLCRGAMELARALGERPDVFHAHDWQTGLVPVYARALYGGAFAHARSVLTIHNMAYQGVFPAATFPATGLDWARFNWEELEFWGQVNLLKGGLVYADAITTVSPTYARQIQQAPQGCGLEGVLRLRAEELYGILNGADYGQWDARTDPHLPAHYDAASLEGKARCKAALQQELGLPANPGAPLLGMVGRFAEQKGFALLDLVARGLVDLGAQVAILGSGDGSITRRMQELAGRFPGAVAARTAFDEGLAHRIQAGADIFLMPSLYEPCGLGQIYAMRYGTVPVVHATGGLADTVGPQTGFRFEPYHATAFYEAAAEAVRAYRVPGRWRELVRAGMSQDFSWERSAREYAALYERTLSRPARAGGGL
jgi:starch synthase